MPSTDCRDNAEVPLRGLILEDALADRWDVLDRVPIGKTVLAELDLPQ